MLFFAYDRNAEIKYNTVKGTVYGVFIEAAGASWSGESINYNEFINFNGTASVRIKGTKNLEIYNNTITAKSNFSQDYGIVHITENNIGETSTGTIFKNNIIANSGADDLISIDSNSVSGTISENNLLFQNRSGYIGNIEEIEYDFVTWQGLGFE